MPSAPIVMFLTGLASLFPRWTPFFMPNPVSPDRIWRNEVVMQSFINERVREMGLAAGGLKFCLGTALALVRSLEAVKSETIPGLEVPFFVAHGTKDYGVPITGSEYLLKHAKTSEEDRCVRFIDGAFHCLLSEDTRYDTVNAMVTWMDSRI